MHFLINFIEYIYFYEKIDIFLHFLEFIEIKILRNVVFIIINKIINKKKINK